MAEGSDHPTDEGTARRDRVLDHLVGFVHDLRRRGVHIPSNGPIAGAQALAVVGSDDTDQARIALRAAIVSREEDLDTFDALFPEFWRSLRGEGEADPWTPPEQQGAPGSPGRADRRSTQGNGSPPDGGRSEVDVVRRDGTDQLPDRDGRPDSLGADGIPVTSAVYSPSGPSRPIDAESVRSGFAQPTELATAVQELGAAVASLRGRRWGPIGAERLDARRVLRQSITTGGTVSTLPRVDRSRTGTHATILVDVSQSVLDTIDRDVLVRFLEEAHTQWWRVRSFFFDTELREITGVFDDDRAGGAIRALERAETEWGGGTRIGKAIEAACRTSPAPVDRDTAVFVVSDGLEVGEIDRLEAAMAELARRSRVVLWLNPLAGDAAYEPSCRGMRAALPHIDGLFPFTGPDDLLELARQLRQRGPGGRIGYEYDPRRFEDGRALPAG